MKTLGDVDDVVLGRLFRTFRLKASVIAAIAVLRYDTPKEASAAYAPYDVNSYGNFRTRLSRMREVLGADEGTKLSYDEIREIIHAIARSPSDENHRE